MERTAHSILAVEVSWTFGTQRTEGEMPAFLPFVVAVVVIASMVMLFSAADSGQPSASPGAGRLVYRYPPALRLLAFVLAVGPPMLVTALLVVMPPKGLDDYRVVFQLYALGIIVSGPLIWEVVRFSMAVGPDGIEGRSPWQSRRTIPWAEVAGLSCNPLLGYIVVRSKDERKFRVSMLVAELDSFLETCERHLPVETLGRSKRVYNMVGRSFPTVPSQTESQIRHRETAWVRFRVEGMYHGRPAPSNVFVAKSADEARQKAEEAGITVSSVQPDGEPL